MPGSQKDAELPSVVHEHLEAHCPHSPLQACLLPLLLTEVVLVSPCLQALVSGYS